MSQPTRVYHVRKDTYEIYVGRSLPGVKPSLGPRFQDLGWGNPFPASRNHQGAITAYRKWLQTQPHLLARLPELKGRRLGCWCAPAGGLDGDLHGRICHGQILAALADECPAPAEPDALPD